LIEKDEDNRFPLKVISKDLISPDTYRMELEFPDKDWIAGIWPAGHYKLFLNIDGKLKFKPFTSISPVNEKGKAVFAVKVYREHPEWIGKGIWSKAFEK
jgi:NAD(P)H-flavin reductase